MNYFKNLMEGCEEASFLAIRHKESPLPFRKRLEVSFHLMVCRCCSNFVKQTEIIDKSLHGYFNDMKQHPPLKVSGDFKSMLKEKLK
jgi:hypothetical protein